MEEVIAVKISDEELLREGLNHLGEAASFLFEIETDTGKAIAFMVDNVIRYGEHLLNDRDPRSSQEFYDSLDDKIKDIKDEVNEILDKRETYTPNCS